jgi:nitrite reductase/ring-hydroxylating ferredoxin subunit/extradiol dioxygenase family protein
MERFDEFDHIVINVNDLLYAEHWYSTVLGEILGPCEIGRIAGLSTDELIHSQRMAQRRAELRDTGGEIAAPHGSIKFGEALIPIFLNQEHVPEPPPEQLRGTPRMALPVTTAQMDTALEALRRHRVPFEGPVEYPSSCPVERSIFFKDPSGNFLELGVPRNGWQPRVPPSPYSSYAESGNGVGQRPPLHFLKMLLEVSDLDKSETFYREDLGLQFTGRDLWPDEGQTSTFQTGDGSFVVLRRVDDVKRDGPGVHRNFMVPEEDYYRIHGRLKERGWLRPNYMTEMGLRGEDEVTCSFFDPDRHRLQLTAWRGEYTLPAAKKGKVTAGRLDDFPVGSVTHIREGKFYLVRKPEGVLALSEVCTHRQCNVQWQQLRWQFICPCHHRRFSREGDALGFPPDVAPLHSYGVEIVDGKIVVDTDTSIARTPEEVDRLVPVPVTA